MKRFFKFSLILLLTICVTGCGKDTRGVSKDGFVYYENASILDNYDDIKIDDVEDVTYKKLSYKTAYNKLVVVLVVKNESNDNYNVNAIFTGSKKGESTDEEGTAYKYVASKSSNILFYSFDKSTDFDVEINTTKITSTNYVNTTDYSYDGYEKTIGSLFVDGVVKKSPSVTLKLKYEGNEANSLQVNVLGFKDNKLVCATTSYGYLMNDNGTVTYSKDISKKNDRGLVEVFCKDGTVTDELDKVIYFQSGLKLSE